MRYMFLIYTNEATDAKQGTPEADARMQGYMAFGQAAEKAIRAGDRLHPVAAAKTVRVRNGSTVAADGPFAETKEQLGGYYILELNSMDEAVSYAERGRGSRKRPAHGWDSITPTEKQVIDLVSSGLTNAQIADRLIMSPRTVQTHLTHVFQKLGCDTRAQLTGHL